MWPQALTSASAAPSVLRRPIQLCSILSISLRRGLYRVKINVTNQSWRGGGPVSQWNADLSALFAPFQLNGLILPNRFVMAPMTRSFSPGGVPPPATANYYRRRVEGEAGLIITEGVGVPHEAAIGYSGVDVLNIPSMYGHAALEAWRYVVDEVHAAGGLIATQLWHQGGMRAHGTGAWPDAISMRPSGKWGPLARPTNVDQAYIDRVAADTRPMTEEEIADVIAAFARAAANARDIGFDAIAIHGAHGYLLDCFLWAETNLRQDRWGGDIRRRSAFAVELVKAIRREIGPIMPIILRVSQWKQQDFGAKLGGTPDALGMLLSPIADAGVDVFDVSERNFDTPAFTGSTMCLAGWVRSLTGRPTLAVGSVGLAKGLFESHEAGGASTVDNLGRLAERFANSEFDLVGIGRMMIVHADWVRRARLGLPFSRYDMSMLAALD